jgi:hypothetical protein
MQVQELRINGNLINLIDSPEGLDETVIAYRRDDKYNGMSIEMDVKLKFYCASGKEEIDNEYQRAFVDGIGEITLTEQCNGQTITATFLLDFKKYRANSDWTEIGLIEKNATNNFKDNLTNEIELNGGEDFHVRNLKLKYDYKHNKIKVQEKVPYTILRPNNTYGYADIDLWMLPEAEVDYNRLEDGYNMNGNTLVMESDDTIIDVNINYFTFGNYFNANDFIPNIEGQAIFENVLEDGVLFIKSDGETGFELSVKKGRTNLSYYRTYEYIIIGSNYESPRLVFCAGLNSNNGINGPFFNMNNMNAIGDYSYIYPNQNQTVDYNQFPNMVNGIPIKKGESLWLVTSIRLWGYAWASSVIIDGVVMPAGTRSTWLSYEEIDFKINRSLEVEFITNEKAVDTINNENDAQIYGTNIEAYKGEIIAPQIFENLGANMFQTNCYKDFWITNGERIRNKQKKKPFVIKPENFFDELEKITACGLGIFYNSNVGSLQLQPIEKFYTDIISKIITIDSIDDVTIEPILNMYYNNIDIGYSESKQNDLDLHNKNNYNIKSKGKNTYTKITDWIASKYIIKKAINLGTEEIVKDYDTNIFILSGTTTNGVNYTLSQSSGFASDGVFENPTETNGINRRYATIYNLFRHFRKWGFGLWKQYTTLENNSIFEKKLTWNNTCDLPNTEIEAHKTIIATDYKDKTMIPEYISFEKLMGVVEFWNMRNTWYDIIQVNMPNNTHLGNIITADYKDGIVKFKLIKRQI